MTDSQTPRTWFITGCSRGFGREWAIAALERGDRVAATARDLSTLDDLVTKYGDALLPIQLDVTDRDADFAAVQQAHEHFGSLDIVVNNAGYGQFGFVEELSEEEFRDQMETNVFGAMWVTQAALPFMREQRLGPDPAGLLDRRHLRVPEHRRLPRLQVGARGLLPGAGRGGRELRHPRHADRAGWLLHRLGRSLVEAHHPAAGVRRGPAGLRGGARQAQHLRPRRPGLLGRGTAARRRRRPAAAAGVLRRGPAVDREGRLRVAHRDLGGLGRRRPARPGLSDGRPS